MKFTIEPGTSADIDELEKLYDELNDYLAATTNYPGWIKGVYPVREDEVAGVNDETLYVARYDGRIVGSVILNHQPEKAYENVKWKICVGICIGCGYNSQNRERKGNCRNNTFYCLYRIAKLRQHRTIRGSRLDRTTFCIFSAKLHKSPCQ